MASRGKRIASNQRAQLYSLKGVECSADRIVAIFNLKRGRQLIMMIGLPASGKSTLAEKFVEAGWVRLNKDALRLELYGDEANLGDVKEVNRLFYSRLEEALKAGRNVLVDNLNFNESYRKGPIEMARSYGYASITNLLLNVPVEECIRRNAGRSRQVPEQVIRDFAVTMYGVGYPRLHEGQLLALGSGSAVGQYVVERLRKGSQP